MSVVVVSRSLPPDVGGYQRQLSLLLPRLVADGLVVEAVGAARTRPVAAQRAGWPQVPTAVVPGWRLPRRLRGLGDLAVIVLAMSKGWRRRRQRPSLLLLSPTMLGAAALIAWWSRRVGVVVMRFPGAGDASRLAARRAMRWARRSSVRSIVMSPQQLAEVEAAGLGEAHLIPNAVEPPPEGGAAPDGAHFLFVGRLIASKGLDVLLDAWEAIEHDIADWELHIIGSGQGEAGDVGPEVARRAAGLERVRLLGAVPDARVHLVPPAVLVHPSTREGLPNAVLEAMAAGVPVVAATTAAAHWFVDPPPLLSWDGVSAASLSGVLLQAARSPGWRDEVALAAKAFVDSRHTPAATGRRYAEVLNG